MIAWFAGQPLVFKIVLGGLGSFLLVFLLWRLWAAEFRGKWCQDPGNLKNGSASRFSSSRPRPRSWAALFCSSPYTLPAEPGGLPGEVQTDLFTRAIDQLGSEKLEVRLGGIYALERIARDSEKDHGPIMEVLVAFVRLHAPWPPVKPAEAEKQPAESVKPVPSEKKPKTKMPTPGVKPRPTFRPSSRFWAAAPAPLGRVRRSPWIGARPTCGERI